MISNEELIGYKIAGNRDNVIILSYNITTNNYRSSTITVSYLFNDELITRVVHKDKRYENIYLLLEYHEVNKLIRNLSCINDYYLIDIFGNAWLIACTKEIMENLK